MIIIFPCRSAYSVNKLPMPYWLLILLVLSFLGLPNVYALENQPKAADLIADNQPVDLSDAKYQLLFEELITAHGFTKENLYSVFNNVLIDRKVLQLMDKQWEAQPYFKYRPRFISPQVISDGKSHLLQHKQLFDRVESQYGVNREYIVAIWAIESKYGIYQGKYKVFRTLNTLFAAYPRRSAYFRKELINFIVLCRKNNLNPLMIEGSYAGAFGQGQFMPSSYLHYAVDFDNDKRVDLMNSHADVFASIANYLSNSGWVLDAPVYAELGDSLKSDLLETALNKGRKGHFNWRLVANLQKQPLPRAPKGSKLSIFSLKYLNNVEETLQYYAGYVNFQAITQYNHSPKYAMVVSELAQEYTR